MTDAPLRRWLAKRRQLSPPATMTDEIMSRVVKLEGRRRDIWWLRLAQRIEQSRPARWAVCGGALFVGSVPFVFLAYVAKLVTI